jgi:hypothetical protein
MADYRAFLDVVGSRPGCFNLWGRTEPDLHLIKQVEQVARLAWNRLRGTSPGF